MIKKVKIGSVTYKIKEKKKIRSRGDYYIGLHDYQNAQITVDKTLAEQIKAAVLVHECVHAILNEAGMREHSEEMVDILGKGFTALIRHNPELMEYIKGATEDGELD
jgi:hypothetical protein